MQSPSLLYPSDWTMAIKIFFKTGMGSVRNSLCIHLVSSFYLILFCKVWLFLIHKYIFIPSKLSLSLSHTLLPSISFRSKTFSNAKVIWWCVIFGDSSIIFHCNFITCCCQCSAFFSASLSHPTNRFFITHLYVSFRAQVLFQVHKAFSLLVMVVQLSW